MDRPRTHDRWADRCPDWTVCGHRTGKAHHEIGRLSVSHAKRNSDVPVIRANVGHEDQVLVMEVRLRFRLDERAQLGAFRSKRVMSR